MACAKLYSKQQSFLSNSLAYRAIEVLRHVKKQEEEDRSFSVHCTFWMFVKFVDFSGCRLNLWTLILQVEVSVDV